MLIAIISDIHDNLPNLETCLDWCRQRKVANLIFCGDAARAETLDILAAGFSGDIFLISGNAELYESGSLAHLKNLRHCGEIGQIELEGCRLGFCHEPYKIKRLLTQTTKFDFIFYGHTHKPWLEFKDGCALANPGNLAGTAHQATFASLNTQTKELRLHVLAALAD